MVGALLGLGLAVWAFFSVALPRVAEAVLSGALGVPVRVVAARPTWPLRLLATGVTIGPDAAPTVSVARLYLAADFATWFGGVPSGVRVEFWGPRVHAVDGRDELLDGLLRRLSKFPSDGAPVRIDSLRFDESRIEQRDGLPIVVAGFELSDLEVSRSQPNAVSVSAELAVMTSVGRLVAEVGLADGGEPGLLVGVDATDLSLGVLVRDPAWQLGGRASGRVWYERFRQEGVLEALVGVDVSIQDFVYGADDQRLVAFDELSLVGVSVDPLQRRVSIQELVGAGWARRSFGPTGRGVGATRLERKARLRKFRERRLGAACRWGAVHPRRARCAGPGDVAGYGSDLRARLLRERSDRGRGRAVYAEPPGDDACRVHGDTRGPVVGGAHRRRGG